MRKWAKEHGLLLANAGIFLVFFGGMIISGAAAYSEEQAAHGQPGVSVLEYLTTGNFVEATFENWESEFLQMAMYVILTVFLFQKGFSGVQTGGRAPLRDRRVSSVPTFTSKGRTRPATEPGRRNAMDKILRTIVVALALIVALPLLASAAHAAPSAATAAAVRAADVQVAVPASTSSPSPTDPASTGPANPGTGETGGAEATRLDYAPLVIGAVALITLVVVLIWRRRRNTTIV